MKLKTVFINEYCNKFQNLNDILTKLNSFNTEFLSYICCKDIIVIESGHILTDLFMQIMDITKIIDVLRLIYVFGSINLEI